MRETDRSKSASVPEMRRGRQDFFARRIHGHAIVTTMATLAGLAVALILAPACDGQNDRDPWSVAEVVPAVEGMQLAASGNTATHDRPVKGLCAPAADNGPCRPGTLVPDTIRIGIPELLVQPPVDHPELDPLIPLADYLGEKVGHPVQFVRLSQYSHFTEGILAGTLHGALFPPGEYLRARNADPCLRIVGTTLYGTSTSYTTNLIVRRDSKIMVPSDLRGKRIAFSSRSSASGYLFATEFLAQRGLFPGRDYESVFTGGHQETIKAVELGTVDAGATFGRALGVEVKIGRELSEVSILAIAGQIPNEPLAFSSTLAPTLIHEIATAFLALNNRTADGRRLLGSQEMMSGWVPSDDSVYDGLRRTVEDVDRLVRESDSAGGND